MSSRLPRISVRPASLLGAAGLTLGSALLAVPAHAAPSDGGGIAPGDATAVAAQVNLEVSVLDGVKVPVHASLNAVKAPGNADKTLLKAQVKGVHDGQNLALVKAKVAHSSAKVDSSKATGAVELVGVRALTPGLLKPLLTADLLKADATCVQGQKPTASAKLENVEVLGKHVDVQALQGSKKTEIKVPGVGNVTLNLEKVTTTDSSGAATALKLAYTVNPAALNVVKTTGDITLVKATCGTPVGSSGSDGGENGGTDGGSTGGSEGADSGASAGSGTTPQGGDHGSDLAETGASSTTPVIGGIGAAVLLAGGGTLFMLRRRKAAQGS